LLSLVDVSFECDVEELLVFSDFFVVAGTVAFFFFLVFFGVVFFGFIGGDDFGIAATA
jgi:hypothetical protein